MQQVLFYLGCAIWLLGEGNKLGCAHNTWNYIKDFILSDKNIVGNEFEVSHDMTHLKKWSLVDR